MIRAVVTLHPFKLDSFYSHVKKCYFMGYILNFSHAVKDYYLNNIFAVICIHVAIVEILRVHGD